MCRFNICAITIIAHFVLLTIPVLAGDLYTIRSSDGMLRKIDTNTLEVTSVGRIQVPYEFPDLAWDSHTKTMYMVPLLIPYGDDNLYTLDLQTGLGSVVGKTGQDGKISVIAYDPVGSRLMGSNEEGMLSIDVRTGKAEYLGGWDNYMDFMMYDPHRDALIGQWANRIYDINRETLQATRIVIIDTVDSRSGMAYDADTGLYWLIDWYGNLYTYDPDDSWQRTLVKTGLGRNVGLVATNPPPCLRLNVGYLTAGGKTRFEVVSDEIGMKVLVVYGFKRGSTSIDDFNGHCFTFGIHGVSTSNVLFSGTISNLGHLRKKPQIPAEPRRAMYFQAAGLSSCPDKCMSNVVRRVIADP